MHYASLSIKFYFLIFLSCDATGACFPFSVLSVILYLFTPGKGQSQNFSKIPKFCFLKCLKCFRVI